MYWQDSSPHQPPELQEQSTSRLHYNINYNHLTKEFLLLSWYDGMRGRLLNLDFPDSNGGFKKNAKTNKNARGCLTAITTESSLVKRKTCPFDWAGIDGGPAVK